MVVLRMDRSIAEDVICKYYVILDPLEIPASHVATQGKKGAPGQILGGLLTLLLIFFSYNHFIAALDSNRGYMNSRELIQACTRLNYITTKFNYTIAVSV